LGKSYKYFPFDRMSDGKKVGKTHRKKSRQKEKVLLRNVYDIDEDTFNDFEQNEKRNSFLVD